MVDIIQEIEMEISIILYQRVKVDKKVQQKKPMLVYKEKKGIKIN